MYKGYRDQVLVIDLTHNKIETMAHDLSRVENYLFDNLEQGIDHLRPENILVISTGPLTGTLAPSSNRYTIAAKSPLTGGIDYANAGGHFAPELAYAGYDDHYDK